MACVFWGVDELGYDISCLGAYARSVLRFLMTDSRCRCSTFVFFCSALLLSSLILRVHEIYSSYQSLRIPSTIFRVSSTRTNVYRRSGFSPQPLKWLSWCKNKFSYWFAAPFGQRALDDKFLRVSTSCTVHTRNINHILLCLPSSTMVLFMLPCRKDFPGQLEIVSSLHFLCGHSRRCDTSLGSVTPIVNSLETFESPTRRLEAVLFFPHLPPWAGQRAAILDQSNVPPYLDAPFAGTYVECR